MGVTWEPVLSYALLLLSVLAMSSGGIWFTLMPEVPPMLRAVWRLWITAFMQLPCLLVQLLLLRRSQSLPLPFPQLISRWAAAIPRMLLAGTALALHFCSWSWSIDHTTMPLSLLFVCTTPLIIVVVGSFGYLFTILRVRCFPNSSPSSDFRSSSESLSVRESLVDPDESEDSNTFESLHSSSISSPDEKNHSLDGQIVNQVDIDDDVEVDERVLYQSADQNDETSLDDDDEIQIIEEDTKRHPPTALEIIGAVIGFLSAVLLVVMPAPALSHNATAEPVASAAGDLAAFFGALTFMVYLQIGSDLRQWMPLFMYAFPVTTSSAVFSAIVSMLYEGTGFCIDGPSCLFGWASSLHLLMPILGAALVSGILGHTLLARSLLHVTPLVASVVLLAEPILGSLLAWLIGYSSAPSSLTAVAGLVLLAAAAITTLGDRQQPYNSRFLVWCRRRILPLVSCSRE